MELLEHPEIKKQLLEIRKFSCTDQFRRSASKFFWLKAYSGSRGGLHLFDAGSNKLAGPNRSTPEYFIANIVFQGGGMLGIAHTGFIAGMETAGFRFLGVAGASAGAIVATGVVAERGANLLKATYPGITNELSAAPMDTFIDGPYRVRRLIKLLLQKKPTLRVWELSNWLAFLFVILRKRGLNPGDLFQDWIREYLSRCGMRTIDDLTQNLSSIQKQVQRAAQKIKSRRFTAPKNPYDLFAVISSAMPVGRKFNFPKDIQYLNKRYSSESPAIFVRASMSIPGFFEPYRLETSSNEWREVMRKEMAGLLPESTLEEIADLRELEFLDGGIFSNLPSDSFSESIPELPTIGVPMVGGESETKSSKPRGVAGLLRDVVNVADAIRLQRDREMISKYSDKSTNRYPFALCKIDTKDHNWLNFVMSESGKAELFLLGLERARMFLENGEYNGTN